MSELARYVVEAMIRDALLDARGDWMSEVADLRDELRDVRADLAAVERTLQARTEHLV